jgi:hypothetical protein
MTRKGFIGAFLGLLGYGTMKSEESVSSTTLEERVKPIYSVRIWKLGSLEHRIYPTQEAINKLQECLNKWDGKSDLNLIWGPELSMEQHLVSEDGINAIISSPDVKIVSNNDYAKQVQNIPVKVNLKREPVHKVERDNDLERI